MSGGRLSRGWLAGGRGQIRGLLVLGWAMVGSALGLGLGTGLEAATVYFEGRVGEVDAALMEGFAGGQYLTGTLNYSAAAAEAQVVGDRFGRYEGFAQKLEFALDRNHVSILNGVLDGVRPQQAIIERGADDAPETDRLIVTLPVRALGHASSAGLIPAWLSFGFEAQKGQMLEDGRLPTGSLAFSSGWFRLAFFDAESSEYAYLTGVMDRWEKAESVPAAISAEEEIAALETIVTGLNRLLDARETEIRDLRSRLAAAEAERNRLQSLLQERGALGAAEAEELRQELASEKERSRSTMEEVEALLSELEALEEERERERLLMGDRATLESERLHALTQSARLQAELAQALQMQARLRDEINRLRGDRPAGAATDPVVVTAVEPLPPPPLLRRRPPENTGTWRPGPRR